MEYTILILAVFIGVGITYIFKGVLVNNSKLLLTFSGAYLLGVAILHLLPEVYHYSNNEDIEVFILLGILLQIILEFFSKGAEHGHLHYKTQGSISLVIFISLCIHAFVEGIPINYHSHVKQHHLLSAIWVHKVAISVILSIFFINSKIKRYKVVLYLLIFSLMTPLGSLMSNILPVYKEFKAQINALVLGVFLHISTVILFESSKNHSFNLRKMGLILLGMSIAYTINT